MEFQPPNLSLHLGLHETQKIIYCLYIYRSVVAGNMFSLIQGKFLSYILYTSEYFYINLSYNIKCMYRSLNNTKNIIISLRYTRFTVSGYFTTIQRNLHGIVSLAFSIPNLKLLLTHISSRPCFIRNTCSVLTWLPNVGIVFASYSTYMLLQQIKTTSHCFRRHSPLRIRISILLCTLD